MTDRSGIKTENRDKALVIAITAVSFLCVLIFNLLTPMLTDDYSYGTQVREAAGLMDLVRQEAHQYMTWNGRSVVHLILRVTLFLPRILFKFASSIVFAVLSVCIYLQIHGRKKWDPFVMLMVQLGLWLFTVDFAETILWQTGAVNYLWGTTIILGFMTLLKRRYQREAYGTGLGEAGTVNADGGKAGAAGAAALAGFFIFGILAGWCNENTSGGCFLFVLFMILRARLSGKVPAYLYAAGLGNLIGLFIMVLAPGNAKRASFATENHSGLYGMAARFQKATLTIRDYFLVLLIVLLVCTVITILRHRREFAAWYAGREQTKEPAGLADILRPLWEVILFTFLFFATAYALILTVQPQPRAYFGAGIFLLIAVIQAIQVCVREEREADCATGDAAGANSGALLVRAAAYSVIGALALSFFFTYIDCGAQLARINRDCEERIDYILQKKAEGADEIFVAQIHPEFENRYTIAYESDLTDDEYYWTNVAYQTYFGVESIYAIPYDEWKAIR